MPDLNKMMDEVKRQTDTVKSSIENLLISYDSLFRECNSIYMEERMASNGEVDRDFHNLLHVIKRNRDLTGAMMRGLKSIRTLNGKFIEEDVSKQKSEPVVDEKVIETVTIPEESTENG